MTSHFSSTPSRSSRPPRVPILQKLSGRSTSTGLQCHTVAKASQFHSLTHVNWRGLRCKYPQVPIKDLKKIIHTCRSCQTFLQVPPLQPMGSNPQGFCPDNLWKLDVTHYSPFGKLKYIFVTVNTFYHACWTLAHAGEKSKHAISHMLQSFAIFRLSDQIKTDNGPCFTSKPFSEFLQTWKISHTMGIPYNPRRKAIVERQNQAIKSQLQKQKEGSLPPHDQLKKALFSLNKSPVVPISKTLDLLHFL